MIAGDTREVTHAVVGTAEIQPDLGTKTHRAETDLPLKLWVQIGAALREFPIAPQHPA